MLAQLFEDPAFFFLDVMTNILRQDVEFRIPVPIIGAALFQLGNQLWHTDSSFKAVPSLCSLLSARIVPPVGGNRDRERKRELSRHEARPVRWEGRAGALRGEYAWIAW